MTRVCMIVKNDCRYDYRVLKEARSLARNGYDVTVVAVNFGGPAETEEDQDIKFMRISIPRGRNILAKAFFLFLLYAWRAARAAAAEDADVYHAQGATALIPAFIAARIFRKAALIFDAHEPSISFFKFRELPYSLPVALAYWIMGKIREPLVRASDAVITVNDLIADEMARYFAIPRPAVVMNCPPKYKEITLNSQHLRKKLGIGNSCRIVIYQGAFVKSRHGRGLETLVKSAALLNNAVILLLGWGPQGGELRKLVEQLGLDSRVKFLAAVSPDVLLDYTSAADVGVVPTEPYHRVMHYSSPNKFFEYLNAGLPVVTSELPVVTTILKEYELGLVCDHTSPKSIADAINRILSDPALYSRMRRGALRAAQRYNWENQEKILLETYRKVLDARRGD